MKALSKSFLGGALFAFLGWLALAELILRLSVPAGFWYGRFDFSGDLTSLAELQDRIRFATPSTAPRLVLLGDSVLGASALLQRRVSQARRQTLSQDLRAQMGSQGWRTLSLGSDGMLLPDLLGLNTELAQNPPQRILLLLNFRMFAKEFADGPTGLSRGFLRRDLPADLLNRVAPQPAPGLESRLSDGLYAFLCRHWFLFRESQMWKTLWYYPSQKDFFERVLEKIIGRNNAQADILEAALKQKIIPYYQPYVWNPSDLSFICLDRLLSQWKSAGIPVVVVLTPQNPAFLGGDWDRPSFIENRQNLRVFLAERARPGLLYRDWSGRYPPSFFLDHCHLTPEGNRCYAKDLSGLCAGEKP